MNTKTTRRAFVSSLVALLICFAMLLGTTFAWFTDSVSSTGNIIKSGTLKIDLVHVGGGTNGEDVSLKSDSNHKVFDYDKWEPGYTQVETLKIVNEGTLALKYQLTVFADPESSNQPTFGTDGENLADVIDVYLLDAATDTSTRPDLSAVAPVGTLASLMADPDGAAYGVLYAKGDEAGADQAKVTIALKMREDAGDEYQGLSLGNVYIYLTATQYTHESDSFGNTYDASADYPDVSEDDPSVSTVSIITPVNGEVTADKLMAAAGETVTLTVTPSANYVLDTLTVTDASGASVSVTDYKFTMPAGNVTVSATFVEFKDFTVTSENRSKVGYTETDTNLVIPETFQDTDGTWYRVTAIGGWAFAQCTSLEKVTIPASVTTISTNAFQGCSNLTTVKIPDSVTTIGNGAFEGCTSLEEVTIPASVTTIGGWAFAYCENLKTVNYLGNVPPTGSDVFYNTPLLQPVNVPVDYAGEKFCGIEVNRTST